MGKKILVVNEFDDCLKCPCRRYLGEESDLSQCGYTFEYIPEEIKILPTCPLKALPPRISSSEGVSEEFANGWNAAIDQIELG